MKFFSVLFSDFMVLLPTILAAVRGVEQASTAVAGVAPLTGPAKKAIVVGTVAAAASQAGSPLTSEQAMTVANVNDAVVAMLNSLGLLKPVAPPAV